MNIHSYSGPVGNEIRYKNPGNNFSGIIFYTEMNNKFINGWEYKDGRIVAATKQISSPANNRAPEEDCYTYEIDTYERDCYYFADPSLNYCTDWMYVGTTTYTNCPDEGGGGGGGVNPADVENALLDFKSKYEISETSYMDGITLNSQSSSERSKSYTWVCGEAAMIKVKSTEYGVHKKVNNEWRWKSLTHQSVYIVGTVIGGSVSVSSHSGLSQLGLYWASMRVDYVLQYNCIIPSFSPINWSADHHPSVFINVND